MTNERRELVKALVVADYSRYMGADISFEYWIDSLSYTASDILAALDKESPPAQSAADRGASAPSQEGAGSATAAPVGEPQERTCVWTPANNYQCIFRIGCATNQFRAMITDDLYCGHCGGRIVEAT